MITDCGVTPELMFNNMKNNYQALREGWQLSEFYKTTVETYLLKIIYIQEKAESKNALNNALNTHRNVN